VGKRIVTEADIESLAKDGVIEVVRGMVLTPLAREHASRMGIRLVYAGGSVPSAEDLPRDPVTGRKGAESEGALRQAVADEVVKALAEMSVSAARVIPPHSPLASPDTALRLAEAKAGEPQRAVCVATGHNHPGIAAALSNAIGECGVDIQDLSQTLVSDFFSMIFVLNLDTMTGGLSFKGFKERMEAAGKAVGVEVVVIHEAILKAMHRP
jgi:ACT domain-containing protein